MIIMQQFLTELTVETRGEGPLRDHTGCESWVRGSGIETAAAHPARAAHLGLAPDPGERRSRGAPDLERFFRRLVPRRRPAVPPYGGRADDMPAHVRAALTATTLSCR